MVKVSRKDWAAEAAQVYATARPPVYDLGYTLPCTLGSTLTPPHTRNRGESKIEGGAN